MVQAGLTVLPGGAAMEPHSFGFPCNGEFAWGHCRAVPKGDPKAPRNKARQERGMGAKSECFHMAIMPLDERPVMMGVYARKERRS